MCVSSVDTNSKTWRCLRPPMAAVPCWSLVLPHILRKLSERAAMLIGPPSCAGFCHTRHSDPCAIAGCDVAVPSGGVAGLGAAIRCPSPPVDVFCDGPRTKRPSGTVRSPVRAEPCLLAGRLAMVNQHNRHVTVLWRR